MQGALDYALHYALRALPIGWCSAIGGWLGELAGRYRFQVGNRVARDNYARLRGDTPSAAEIDAAMRRMWNHLGRVMSEFSVLDRFWDAGRIELHGEAHLAAARTHGAVLVMGLHIGNWEAVVPTLPRLGCKTSVIYQPPRNRFQHRIAVAARRRCGVDLLEPSIAGMRTAYRVLSERDHVLLIHVDEWIRRRVNGPLFGRMALRRSNLTLVARLAMMTGAPVVRAVTERLNGARFRVTFSPALILAGDPDHAAELTREISRLDAAITPPVLAQLDQWLWLQDLRLERG